MNTKLAINHTENYLSVHQKCLQLENSSHSTETSIAVILCRGSCISRKHNLSLKSYKVKVRLQSLVDGKKFVFWTLQLSGLKFNPA